MSKHTLSKSTFLRGCKCHKALHLYKNNYKLRDEISEAQQAIFSRGTNIGILAQQLFPGGVDASPPSVFEFQKSVVQTQQLIKNGCKIIYEAAFQYNDVLVALDILVKKRGKWFAYEVKGATDVKDIYILDAAVQYHVITNAGIDLKDISIIHLNREYVRKGDLDVDKLFLKTSVLDQVEELQNDIIEKIVELKDVIKQKKTPDIDIGPQCYAPYLCDFLGHCWKHIPEKSVFEIHNLNVDKKFEMYYKGIIKMKDIPDDYHMSANHKLQIDSLKTNKGRIDKKGVKEFLSTLSYPMYFMDFETIWPAVPLFDQMKPYQQVPFQFSLHYKKSKKSKLEHVEFLAEEGKEPRRDFMRQLLDATSEPGDILVYNKTFEITRMNEIARDFPEFAKEIEERVSRIKDLMAPFQNKSYYVPAMNGSYSIKAVLPALVPELSYDSLLIHEGGMASLAYEQLPFMDDNAQKEQIKTDLLEYCKLDTFAMVRVLEVLEKV